MLNPSDVVQSGATWRRVDFHLHTPAVASFACPDRAELRTEEGRAGLVHAYVDALATADISLCAITDYNCVREEWFVPIRDCAAQRGITVLPGVELSVNYGSKGLHILVIFDASATPAAINAAILGLDKNPSKALIDGRKHRDIDLRVPLSEAIQDLRRQLPCLVIPPHPEQVNGLCRTVQAKAAARELRAIRADAIEHCPKAELDRLVSTGEIDAGFVAGLAQVEFSDPKRIEQIGNKSRGDGTPRATWLKLSSTAISAIQLALHDPTTRVCVGSVPEPRHARIARMEVQGSGFLGRTVLAWNVDLNVLIGGRGTGKSAIVETLRYALGIAPYAETSYREALVRHSLGSGGKVTLMIERPTVGDALRRYRVERVFGEEPVVYDAENKSPLEVAPLDLFGPGAAPAIFGQREIYVVSGNDEYRLRLLDDLIGDEARQRATAVREAAERLRDNSRQVLDAARKLARRDEHEQRRRAIEHEIKVYEREGATEKLRSVMALRSDGQQLRAAAEAVDEHMHRLAETAGEAQSSLNRTAARLREGESREKAILAESAAAIDRLARELAQLAKAADAAFVDAARAIAETKERWRHAVKPLEDELNRIKQALHLGALDPDQLLKLTEEKSALTPLLGHLARLDEHRRELLAARRQVLDDLKRRRLEEHQLRRERAEAITTQLRGRLRLRVEFKGQKQEYRARLSSILKGSRVTDDVLDRLVAPEATDGMALADAVRAGTGEVESRFGLTTGMAQRLVAWLPPDDERFFELQTLVPSDAVHVELKVDDGFRSLDKLSVGQRATAILLLLFALRGRILILDQPEDDLDNRFVYEDIVSILRDQKGLVQDQDRRQIIAATHNANIPVLGDAEQVVALEAEGGRARIVSRASIDDPATRALIKHVMEGGDEAFRRRAEKYGEA